MTTAVLRKNKIEFVLDTTTVLRQNAYDKCGQGDKKKETLVPPIIISNVEKFYCIQN